MSMRKPPDPATCAASSPVPAVEFFIANGKLLVNEIAPRPHNSGHYTIDACITSQFEQQVRALCGLPLGDMWLHGAPRWERVLGSPRAKLHLYGKQEARPGRKMGHYTCLASTPAKARSEALALRRSLARRPAKRK
jgi:5-(carboxyamino)imidazole ribonucleotide synthase